MFVFDGILVGIGDISMYQRKCLGVGIL